MPVCPTLTSLLVSYAIASLIPFLPLCQVPSLLKSHLPLWFSSWSLAFGRCCFMSLSLSTTSSGTLCLRPETRFYSLLSTLSALHTFPCNTCENSHQSLAELFLICVCLMCLSLPACEFLKGKDNSFKFTVVFPAISWGHQIFAERKYLWSPRQMISWEYVLVDNLRINIRHLYRRKLEN